MRRTHRALWGAGLTATLVVTALAAGPATAGSTPAPGAAPSDRAADVQPWLAHQLTRLDTAAPTTVLVHGRTLADATDAVEASGMTLVTTFDRIGVAVANGTAAEVQSARTARGVTYLEGNQPIAYSGETSHRATRGIQASRRFEGRDGSRLNGSGVSVGLIDSGVDPTHPFLTEQDGSTAVVANLKVLCDPLESTCQVIEVPTDVDTDTTAAGGHGTHVAGIIAGRPTELSDGSTIRGAAPGANLVSLSTGAALVILGADAALNWVLEHHARPCGPGVSRRACPPIRVTNNSYGPTGGGRFDPRSATVKLQRELASEGVLTVWANGNDGGNGSQNVSNPPGQDPTPGVVSVASYFDRNTGTRNGVVSDFSSRGKRGRLSTYPDISAPGEEITSSCRIYLPICSTGGDPQENGDFNTISGTSMAAPHIAGIVAQLLEGVPRASVRAVERSLKLTAHRFTDGARYVADPRGGRTSFDKGHGLVDVVAAFRRLKH